MTQATFVTTWVTLDEVTRLTNSRNGNPRFRIGYKHADGGPTWANTAADAAFGYEIGNPGYRVGAFVMLTIGGRGTIVAIAPAGSAAYRAPVAP